MGVGLKQNEQKLTSIKCNTKLSLKTHAFKISVVDQ